MYKKILVASDGSEISKRAAHQAVTLAKHVGAEVRAVFVIDTRVLPGSHPIVPESMAPHYFSLIDEMRKAGDKSLKEVVDEGSKHGVSCKHEILEGTPAECILKDAEDSGAELIVMGTHGRSGFAALLLGSTAQAVVHGAKTPVLLVR